MSTTGDLPGRQEAQEMGYSLYSYSGSGEMARYRNEGGICLKVWKVSGRLQARLVYVYGLIVLSTEDMAFPNRNFALFENQLKRVLSYLPLEG